MTLVKHKNGLYSYNGAMGDENYIKEVMINGYEMEISEVNIAFDEIEKNIHDTAHFGINGFFIYSEFKGEEGAA